MKSAIGGDGAIPLSEWIPRALDYVLTNYLPSTESSIDSGDAAVSSDAYIIPALRIAASLAGQICNVEEDSDDNSHNTLPSPGSSWSSKIVVHDSSNNGDSKPPGGDLDEIGDSILAVTRAQLLSSEGDKNDNTTQEKLRRIHALGLVFYEMFSGGERSLLHRNEESLEFGGAFDPLPIGQENHHEDVHLADALKIIDDLCEDEARQNPQKRAAKENEHSTITAERLKMKKVPGPLCDLVTNMLDCTNGEISSSDTYMSMADVLFDLQLMLDRPAIFLRDIDLVALSNDGLNFGAATLFGRESELLALRNLYQRSLLSPDERKLVLITGPSGSGKSYLSQKFGFHVLETGGVFLSAKFDQLKQARPLSTLASAFNIYCEALSKCGSGDKDVANPFVSELRSRLRDEDIFYLTKIIPSLVNVVGHEHESCFGLSENNCVDAQQRLQFLFCQFVEAIAVSSMAPITVNLDDLHNADDASIGVIKQLLLTFKSTERFYFVVSSREGEILSKMLTNLDYFHVPNIQVKLDNCDELAINKTISELLQLSPRLTRPLSTIAYHRTRGNALFFSRWLTEISKEALLRPSLSRRRWVWDEEEIRRRKVPDDVAMFFQDSIHKLPKNVQVGLCIMACFGASLDGTVTRAIEQALSTPLCTLLNVAISEGLLDKIDDQYRFSHDCIQEAAYNMIIPEEKCLHHFQHGLSLATYYLNEVALGEDNDNILFAAVNQLNHGGPAALSEQALEESFTVATLNLKAGKKAMEMSEFKTAYSFFDNGISFLRKKHWQQHYQLSMELFCLAARCALANGDSVSFQLLSEQIMKNAKTFDEKLVVLYYGICALNFSGQFVEGAAKIESILVQLGVVLEHVSTSNLLSMVEQTRMRLEAFTIGELKSLQRMSDSVKRMTMLFLARLHFCYFMINPEKQPIVIMKMVQIMLSHGMCETSPLALVLFGSLLGKLGYIEKGYEYAKLAKDLVKENTWYESNGVVIAYATQVSCYVEPVQAVLPLFTESYERSMSEGDSHNACVNTLYYINEGYIAGLFLPKLSEKCPEARQLMKKLNHFAALASLVVMERHLKSLMGVSWGSNQPDEEIEDGNPHTIFLTLVYSILNNFMFRKYRDLQRVLQQFLAHNRVDWTLMFLQSECTFIFGLTLFWVARESKEQNWRHAGVDAKQAMQAFTKTSTWNFEHKLFLMDAEEKFCDGNFEEAKILYDKAIKSAKEHRFVNGEAIACELAGCFYLELGEVKAAKEYFVKACERYEMWGAHGKSAILREEIETLFNFNTSIS